MCNFIIISSFVSIQGNVMMLVASKQGNLTMYEMSLNSTHRDISTWWFASKNFNAGQCSIKSAPDQHSWTEQNCLLLLAPRNPRDIAGHGVWMVLPSICLEASIDSELSLSVLYVWHRVCSSSPSLDTRHHTVTMWCWLVELGVV